MSESRLSRYALATIGPVGSAGAQFALSLVMLQRLDLGAFGAFSLLLVACQFSWGIWSALFCAPLPVLLAQAPADDRHGIRLTLLSTSLPVPPSSGSGSAPSRWRAARTCRQRLSSAPMRPSRWSDGSRGPMPMHAATSCTWSDPTWPTA